MTELIIWQCDICGNKYDSIAKTIECENKGIESLVANVGDIVHVVSANNDGIVEDEYDVLRVYKIVQNGHEQAYYMEEESLDDDVWQESVYHPVFYSNSHLKSMLWDKGE